MATKGVGAEAMQGSRVVGTGQAATGRVIGLGSAPGVGSFTSHRRDIGGFRQSGAQSLCIRAHRSDCADGRLVSIVVPALNEQAALPLLADALDRALGDVAHEIIVVDDGSTDATWSVIENLVRRRPAWRGIRLTRRFGHQAALLAGIRCARGDAVITLDADGQHPPACLPGMIRAWRGGARVVQMVRDDGGAASWFKRSTSRLFYQVYSRCCESPIHPASADFRLMDRSVVDLVTSAEGNVPFLRGLVPWLGHSTVYARFRPSGRYNGRTKYSLLRMAQLAIHGVMSFSMAPLRLATGAGLIVGALALVYLIYVTGVGLFSGRAVPGWASIAGLVALVGGVQLLCLGLLGEYVGRLYMLHQARPPFVVAETVGCSRATNRRECIHAG